jgi:hypothetical protein
MRTRDVRCGGISTQSSSGVATNAHAPYYQLGQTRVEVLTGQRAIVRFGAQMNAGGNTLSMTLTVNGVEQLDVQADGSAGAYATPEKMLGPGVYTLGISFWASSSAGQISRGFIDWLVAPA